MKDRLKIEGLFRRFFVDVMKFPPSTDTVNRNNVIDFVLWLKSHPELQ